MDERLPETQPGGALVPPPRFPRTALATGMPRPPRRHEPAERGGLAGLLAGVLDGLDELGDRIAAVVGIR